MTLFREYRGLRKELYVLFIGRIMTNLGSMIWPMFTLILNRKLGFSAAVIAVLMTVFSMVSLPVNLMGGRLADRFNKRNIIIVCDFVSIVVYLVCAAVPVGIPSVAGIACAALFQTVESPAYDALVADFTTSKDRERAYSLSYFGNNLGLVLAPTISGILFNNHLNLAFLINGCSIALSTLLIFLFIKDVHREEEPDGGNVYEAELDDRASALRYVLGSRVILIFICLSAIESTVYNMYNYLIPLDMSRIHGDTGSVLFGTMSSTNCLVVVLCTALITRLFRKMRDTDKMFTGQSLILAGYVIFVCFARLPLLCYAAISVFTLGEIFFTISASPFLTRRIPASHRGRILSLQGVTCSLTASALQIAAGTLYDGPGPAAAWGFIFLLGAALLVLLRVMKRMDRVDHPALYE